MPVARLRAVALGMLVVLALSVAGPSGAQPPATPSDPPDREFVIGAYLWGTEVVGTVGPDGAETDVDATLSDIIDALNVGAMVMGGARVGRFVALFDAMWIELEDEDHSGTVSLGPITLGPAKVDTKLYQGMADLLVGYRVVEPSGSLPVSLDLLAGGRYWYMRSKVDLDFALLPDRSFDDSEDWVDPLVGARLQVALTPRVELIGIGDFGGWGVGSASDSTWQATGLLGVDLSEAWSLRLGYRAIGVDRDLADLELRGPFLGVLRRF